MKRQNNEKNKKNVLWKKRNVGAHLHHLFFLRNLIPGLNECTQSFIADIQDTIDPVKIISAPMWDFECAI